jgi:alcohol dehydrogenase (cytochrome c)
MRARRLAFLNLAAYVLLLGQVNSERIRLAEREPGNWLTYSGNYSAHRHSPLDQVHTGTVSRLKPVWVYQTSSAAAVETTPLVVDGIMYISEPPSNVTALDTRTGRPLWRFQRTAPKDVRVCCGKVNRGVALLDEMVFVGTLDAHLIALDWKTGAVRWDATVAPYKEGYAITVAPLAVKDKVIVGIAGGEYGVRGFVDAYDAKSGRQAWRYWTIPGPGEAGHESWAGDSWKTGSATTWVTGSYDPELNLVYWGTGNPGPDWNDEPRAGDNLYSDSLLALDPDSGKLKWYFQFTPHDVHDWDSTEIPVLANATIRGRERKVVLFANRNAFYYVLDRTTGEFLHGNPFAKQTWAKGLDDNGKPVRIPNMAPVEGGIEVYPHAAGANNWYSPSYSPKTDLFYVAVREAGGIYYKGEVVYKAGTNYNGGGIRDIPGKPGYGAIRALKPASGEVQWEFKIFSAPSAGVLSTAGNLLFAGTNEGDFLALDATSGKSLWRFQTGGSIQSNPVSYLSDGKQQIAIASGNAIFAFGMD